MIALQRRDVDILADADSLGEEPYVESLAYQLRMIILLTQMAEEDIAHRGSPDTTEEVHRLSIAQMPERTADALLKKGRILADP